YTTLFRSFLFLAGECANYLALRIKNFKLGGFLLLFLQVIIQNRAARRIFPDGIASRIDVADPRAPRRAWREKMRHFRSDRSGGLPQRTDIVQHPERTAV